MIDRSCAQKDIPNGRPLGFESSSCAHTDDQIWLESLAGQVGTQCCCHCTHVVHTVLPVFACNVNFVHGLLAQCRHVNDLLRKTAHMGA